MKFESLVGQINQVQDALQAQAAHAINLSLTARNWLVGYYIVEYEQHGEDRAKYGENLINRLAQSIGRKGFEPRSLRVYRRIYLVYPQLGTEIGAYLQNSSLLSPGVSTEQIWQSLPAKLKASGNQSNEIWRSALAKLEDWATPAERLFHRLNYTCLAYLTSIEDPLKRAFYEQETIRGCWTSRELDRQVSSQYYERMGLSKDKQALQRLTDRNAQQLTPRDIIHNPVSLYELLQARGDAGGRQSAHRLVALHRLWRDHRAVRHRRPLAEPFRQQIPPAAALRGRDAAVPHGEHHRGRLGGI